MGVCNGKVEKLKSCGGWRDEGKQGRRQRARGVRGSGSSRMALEDKQQSQWVGRAWPQWIEGLEDDIIRSLACSVGGRDE